MPITPQDIQSKQFHVRMRGFDVDEVDKFLEKIAEEFLILTLENKQIMEKVESLEKEVANFRNKEQTFQNAILSAQRISDEMQEKSRIEAENTLTLAKQESEELHSRIKEEADALQERAAQEAQQLRARAESEAARMEDEARTQIHDLTLEVNTLIEMRDRITDDMKQLLSDYMQRINEGVPANLKGLEKLPEPKRPDPRSFEEETGTRIASPDDDLDDLYEKIDLPEEGVVIEGGPVTEDDIQPEELGLDDLEPFDLGDEDDSETKMADQDDASFDGDPDISIPDLDGDMLFSLDDPLDDLEPSVTISPEENIDR